MIRTRSHVTSIAVAIGLSLALAVTTGASRALAAPGDDGFLGDAEGFAIVASDTITNTGPTLVTGDVALHPGTAVGLLPIQVVGTIHTPADLDGGALALAVRNALIAPYNDLLAATTSAGSATGVNTVSADLSAYTPPGSAPGLYQPGVYASASSLGLSGPITLDAGGNADAVFIFRAETAALTVASGSSVNLINGAQWCNVYWQVGTSATLGTTADFVGTILANASITAQTGATVVGRLLASAGSAGAGAVNLDSNIIDASQACTTVGPPVPPGSGSGSGPEELAETGNDSLIGLAVGSGALLLGLLALIVVRRSRTRSALHS